MGADANIFAQYLRPPKSVNDYMAEMDEADLRREQLTGAERQNALQSLIAQDTMDQRRIAGEDRTRLRDLAGQSGGDTNKLVQLLRGSGSAGLMSQADTLEKGYLDRQKTEAEVGEKKAKTTKEQGATLDDAMKRYRGALDFIDTPEGAARWVQAQYADPVLGEHVSRLAPFEQAVQQIPRDPQGFAQWRQQSAMGMEKFLEQQRQQATQAETVRHNRTTEGLTKRGQDVTASTSRRGQDMTDARQRENNAVQRDAIGKVEWKQDTDGNWLALPKEVRSGEPITPVTTTSPGKRQMQATQALNVISEARALIDKGTSSYVGAGIDQAARLVGKSTQGGDAIAKLKALEGALMMAQPRMEGPQSNMDVALYRQMAGQIGDPTVPADMKRAALDAIQEIHKRYAGPQVQGGSNSNPGPPKAGGAFADPGKEARYQAWKAQQGQR